MTKKMELYKKLVEAQIHENFRDLRDIIHNDVIVLDKNSIKRILRDSMKIEVDSITGKLKCSMRLTFDQQILTDSLNTDMLNYFIEQFVRSLEEK